GEGREVGHEPARDGRARAAHARVARERRDGDALARTDVEDRADLLDGLRLRDCRRALELERARARDRPPRAATRLAGEQPLAEQRRELVVHAASSAAPRGTRGAAQGGAGPPRPHPPPPPPPPRPPGHPTPPA